MEYVSAVWDSNQNSLIQQLKQFKKGQRHAARWIFNHFSRFSSVSAMLNEINYPGYLFGPVAKYQDFKFYIRY